MLRILVTTQSNLPPCCDLVRMRYQVTEGMATSTSEFREYFGEGFALRNRTFIVRHGLVIKYIT